MDDIALRCDFSVGGVGVGGADVTGGDGLLGAAILAVHIAGTAAHGGRDDASQYPNKNLANQVRKNLREYLCVLFGYSHSESPIEQESKNIYRVAFSISFSTGHVDETNSRYVELF